MANLDHMCLDNQSHNSLDIIELLAELYASRSLFVDTIEMNETCRSCRKIVSDFSYKTRFVHRKLQK